MRTKAIALATATGAVLGCSSEAEYQWGMPYQPGIDVDEDDEEPPEDDQADASEDGGPAPPNDADSGGATTSGADPSLTDSITVADASGSTGEPGDSADTGESPYQGGWDIGDCQDEMLSDVADFQLTDSYGDQIRLYDFCHKAIMLTAGSFW